MQIRINEYQSQDNSLLSNEEKLAHLPSGLYYGFDVGAFGANMTLSFNHNSTGITRYSADSNTPSGLWGTIVTRQGTVIFDSDPRTFAIAPTTVASRTDAVICTHTYTLVTNGVVASYAVQQGYNGDESSLPANAVLIGTLFLPANTSELNAVGVVYTDKRIKNIKTLANEIEGLQTQISSLSSSKYDKVQPSPIDVVFLSGWSNAQPLTQPVKYRKEQNGRVSLEGWALTDATGTANIFQLPVDCRPSSAQKNFITTLLQGGGVVASVSISNTGFVSLNGSIVNGTILSLDDVSFFID